MRRRAFLGFVACCLSLLPVGLSVAAVEDVRVSPPVVHDNLAIYFVHGGSTPGVIPVSLEEALAAGRVQVRESGAVNELTVENISNDEVFVQAGDIVKGGRQDRVLSVDLLLPPHSGQVPIAVFCVESGRWSARGREDARRFSTATAAIPSHEAKLAMRAYAPAAAAVSNPGQGNVGGPTDTASRQEQIWTTVSKIQDRLAQAVGSPVAAPASPSSLQLSLENEKLQAMQAAYLSAFSGDPGSDVLGFVVAINGKISSGDVYASPALFRKVWPKLLAASVTEAIGEKDAKAVSAPPAEKLLGFLKAAQDAPESVVPLNSGVRLATRDGNAVAFAETRRVDGGWVHRNYLAK
jgi:hypothetical protein